MFTTDKIIRAASFQYFAIQNAFTEAAQVHSIDDGISNL